MSDNVITGSTEVTALFEVDYLLSSVAVDLSKMTTVAWKRPRSFCQNFRWQVTPKHAYTLDFTKSELADYATVQAQCGNYPEVSSHATCHGMLGHSHLSSLSHCGFILA